MREWLRTWLWLVPTQVADALVGRRVERLVGSSQRFWHGPAGYVRLTSPLKAVAGRVRDVWRTWRYGPEYRVFVDSTPIAVVRAKKTVSVDLGDLAVLPSGPGILRVEGPRPDVIRVTYRHRA